MHKYLCLFLGFIFIFNLSCTSSSNETEVEEICILTDADCNNGIVENCACKCDEGYSGEFCNRLNSSFIQTYLNDGISPFELINLGMPIDSIYGKNFENGIIFSVNSSTKIVKVITTKEFEQRIKWTAAVNFCENLEINGSNDWYFPNLEEVQSIRDNLYYKLKKGNFDDDYYWTSKTSDDDINDAIAVYFLNGNFGPVEKDRQNHISDNFVRAARSIQF